MLAQLRAALAAFALLTLLTGVVYPLAVTATAHLAFADQAEGSLVKSGGTVVGSRLLGQPFEGARYFWGRPSATGPFPYNAGSSSASNLGPTNPAQLDAVKGHVSALAALDAPQQNVPVDLVTASASGLDPDISPAAARYQVGRVAGARHIDPARLTSLVDAHVVPSTLGLLGEPRVNVLALNMALDALK